MSQALAEGTGSSMANVRRHAGQLRLVLMGLPVLLVASCAVRGPAPAAESSVPAAAAPAAEQRFPNSTAAVDALLAACRAEDEAALIAIFGEEAKPLVSAHDTGAGRERCTRFVDAAKQMTRLDPTGPDTLELVVGFDDWPFPIPLVKDQTGWRFDTVQGEQEILRRWVGADELEAIAVCRASVHAQAEYASKPREGRAKAYAQKLVSTPGQKDGLYWPSKGTKDESPFGPLVAAAGDYTKGKRPAGSWWGYYFRVLTAQGKDAPGGTRSYVVDGRMSGGFALVAYPVEYGSTGIMTFLVAKDGRVYQKDLGEKTDEVVEATQAYNPDSTWTVVTD